MSDEPRCGNYFHAYRARMGKFRKGILCLCGANVLDVNVVAGRTVDGGTSSWLMALGWPTLLEAR